jgi:hypothetical protein
MTPVQPRIAATGQDGLHLKQISLEMADLILRRRSGAQLPDVRYRTE